jgi:hypothetical protein
MVSSCRSFRAGLLLGSLVLGYSSVLCTKACSSSVTRCSAPLFDAELLFVASALVSSSWLPRSSPLRGFHTRLLFWPCSGRVSSSVLCTKPHSDSVPSCSAPLFDAVLLFVASALVSSSGLPGGSPPWCSARNLTPTRFLGAPHETFSHPVSS